MLQAAEEYPYLAQFKNSWATAAIIKGFMRSTRSYSYAKGDLPRPATSSSARPPPPPPSGPRRLRDNDDEEESNQLQEVELGDDEEREEHGEDVGSGGEED